MAQEKDTLSRPSRERKTVQHFKPTEKQEKDDKPADKQAGNGTALGGCENSTWALVHRVSAMPSHALRPDFRPFLSQLLHRVP